MILNLIMNFRNIESIIHEEKLDLNKMKTVCSTKDNINGMNRQTIDWGK